MEREREVSDCGKQGLWRERELSQWLWSTRAVDREREGSQ